MGVSVRDDYPQAVRDSIEEIAEIIDPVKWKKVLEGRRTKAAGFETFGAVETGEKEIEKAWQIILLLDRKGVL